MDTQMRIFLALVLVVLAGGVFAMSTKEEKIRVFIVSSMTAQEIDAFYALLEEENSEIDGSFRSPNFNDADVVTYLLDNWNVANIAPGAKELPFVFAGVYKVKSPAVRHSKIATLRGGREINFVFYSTSDTGYAPLKCFALDLAVEAGRKAGELFDNKALVNCMKE